MEKKKRVTLSLITSRKGQTHFENLVIFPERFLKCVLPFWDVMY